MGQTMFASNVLTDFGLGVDVLPALRQLPVGDYFGFAGGAMTLLAFAQTRMLRMRVAAVAANVFFIAFGLLAPASPVLALHVILLPLNLYHLAAYVRTARPGRIRRDGDQTGEFDKGCAPSPSSSTPPDARRACESYARRHRRDQSAYAHRLHRTEGRSSP
jgi:hypothetical protein